MDHALYGFGNARGQADRPVRNDGSRLPSCLLQWQNYGSFPNLWRGPGREAAVENFKQLGFYSWAQRFEEGRRYVVLAGGPLDLICLMARSTSDD